MYEAVLEGKVYRVSSPAVAEMDKILENTYRNINIGLINEMAMLCHKMNINLWEVIEAAKTKPFGFTPFYPGPGSWRPLHSAGPLLSELEGARVWFPYLYD
jgi:UDP-N-acetyl-D-glucosamine dehydrogenase